MGLAPGEKAKFLTVVDNHFAEDMQPLYSIDVMLSKSSKGVKCGGITVYKMNLVDFKMPDPTNTHPDFLKNLEAAKAEASKQTEVMDRPPLLFKETEGRWILWSLEKAISIYDELGGNARITLKCPRLRIEQRRPPAQIASLRSNLRELFPVAWDIDRLLAGDFSYDPWTKNIRRGIISAEKAKR